MLSKRQAGFTIVELLIVIVVIAILAAVSVVAYTGIQNRAEASKTAAAIRAYKDALVMYKADKGTYPATGAFCLGDQYEPFEGETTPSCRYSTSPIHVSGGATSRNLLKPYLGDQLPMPSSKFIYSGAIAFVGGHFYGRIASWQAPPLSRVRHGVQVRLLCSRHYPACLDSSSLRSLASH